jgi:hypothetical protein
MVSFVWKRMLVLSFPLALAACSTGAPTDTADAEGFIPLSCGATQDCVSAGLDADTCVYASTPGNCGANGQCKALALEPTSSCSQAKAFCPCSGGTQMIPACWPSGSSPAPISELGPCPLDAGP